MDNKKSSIGGIDANIIVLLCYLGALLFAWFYDTKIFAWLLPLIIYILERDNEFVKKHAAQATVLYFGYSMISLVIVFISISMFNITNIFTLNLNNFSGSLLMASTLSMIAMLILVVVTIITVIISSKVWHYEDYDISFIKYFVSMFRSFMKKVMKEENDKMDRNSHEEIISGDVKLEDDSEIILEKEIDEQKKDNKNDKKDDKKNNVSDKKNGDEKKKKGDK